MTSSLSLESLKPHLLPIVAVLVVVATVPLAIMPWTTQILDDYENITAQSELRDQLVVKADKLETFNVAASKEILQSTIEPALPSIADPAGALGTLELVAQQVGTTIVGVNYSNSTAQAVSLSSSQAPAATTTAAAPADAEVPVSLVEGTITLEGGYPNLASFIQQSELVSRVINIDSFHLTKNDLSSEVVTATFEFNAPYLPHPTDLGPIEDPFPELNEAETKVIDIVKIYQKTSYSPTNVQNITGRANPFQ